MDKNEFTSDLNVPIEVLGIPAFLSPMLHKISTQRATMFSAHAAQAMVIDGAETPKISTGMEVKIGAYELSQSSRDQDIQIKEIVPKFSGNSDRGLAIHNPITTVIYVGCDDNKIGYIDIPTYTELGDGFGYINKRMNRHLLVKDTFVEKEVKFTSAPNHDGDLYNLGVNATVCYMPDWNVTEDAFVISDRLRDKLAHTVINTITLRLNADDIPLNLYGDEDEYKIFPDLGERVRDDGCVIALRTHNASSLLSDVTAESLRNLEPLHDEMHVAPPGAEIIDVQVYTNQRKYPKLLKDDLYTQIMQYQQQHQVYYESIVNIYNTYLKLGYKFSSSFINLVTRCNMLCYNKAGRQMLLMDKKEPVEYINLKITWAMHRNVDKGFKISDRGGAKGVISDIRKLEDMPVTADGIVADILISGESPFNRLNDGQYTEQFINYVSEVVCNRVRTSTAPVDELYEYVLKYIELVRPIYAKFIRQNTEQDKLSFIQTVRTEGIYFIIPPFCKNIVPATIKRIAEELDIQHQRISYATYDAEGNRIVHNIEEPGLIGSKYIYLLGKIPIDSVNCIEYGYVSQFGLPVKPGSKTIKTQSLIGSTPCRYGEDETMILCMSVDPEVVKRMYGIYATSSEAASKMQMALLTAKNPSNIDHIDMSTKEIIESDISIALLKHQLAEAGYEIVQVDERV